MMCEEAVNASLTNLTRLENIEMKEMYKKYEKLMNNSCKVEKNI